jgi:hypothetical protein
MLDWNSGAVEGLAMKLSVTALFVMIGLAVTACGKSDEEKAQDKVCDARSDIQKQITELENLTIETATTDKIKANVDAIENDLQKIKDAEGDLSAERKQQVETATQQFESQVTSVANTIGRSLSISGAKATLETSVKQLADSYRTTLAPIDCS